MKLKLIWMEKVKHKQPVCRTLALRLAAFHSTTPNHRLRSRRRLLEAAPLTAGATLTHTVWRIWVQIHVQDWAQHKSTRVIRLNTFCCLLSSDLSKYEDFTMSKCVVGGSGSSRFSGFLYACYCNADQIQLKLVQGVIFSCEIHVSFLTVTILNRNWD